MKADVITMLRLKQLIVELDGKEMTALDYIDYLETKIDYLETKYKEEK